MNIVKRMLITDKNGYTITNLIGCNSVAFLAKLPKNAVVEAVKVNGEYLEDIGTPDNGITPAIITYPRSKYMDDCRIVANICFPDGISDIKLYDLACIGSINEFEVFYHEEAIANVE